MHGFRACISYRSLRILHDLLLKRSYGEEKEQMNTGRPHKCFHLLLWIIHTKYFASGVLQEDKKNNETRSGYRGTEYNSFQSGSTYFKQFI
jgi:hypothetical protein